MNTPCHDFEMWSRFLRRQSAAPTPSRIYLDYAAAAPMSEAAIRAMQPFLAVEFGNPGGIHREGVVAKRALEAFREQVAQIGRAHV